MSRILAIDYGHKRTGIAVTDPLQIICTGLPTVETKQLWNFLKAYFEKEPVERIVVGLAKQLDNTPAESMRFINPFVGELKKRYPHIPVEMYDERFTSKMAVRAMIDGGLKKKDRQNKGTIDMVSAVIILQSFLEFKKNQFQF